MFINGLDTSTLRPVLNSSLVSRTLLRSQPHPFRPSTHFMYYHRSGRRSMLINGKRHSFSPGDVIFFFANQEYMDFGSEEPYQAINITFAQSNNDSFTTADALPSPDGAHIYLPNGISTHTHPDIESRFRTIALAHNSPSPFKQHQANVMLLELLVRLAELSQREQSEGNMDYLCHHLDSNVVDNPSIDELASLVGMSRANVTRRFRAHTGMSIHQYALRVKINHARNLMHNTPTMRNKEIAAQLGFYDEYHFSKAFKAIVGQTPRNYRQTLLS